MLSKETFCEALRKIQAQKDRDEQFSKALAMMGDGHFVFEGGALLLAALLDVLKEAINDQYDYISWWLYEGTENFVRKLERITSRKFAEKMEDSE